MAKKFVMGLDLSLTRSAALLIPLSFGNDKSWSDIKCKVFGYDLVSDAIERARMDRCLHIAKTVVEFAAANQVMAVFVEQYAFNRAFNAARLGELGGIVKTQMILSLGMCPKPLTATAARKLVLGRLPSAKSMGVKSLPKGFQKKYTRESLLSAGAPGSWKDDECDAFVIANAGLHECGLRHLEHVGRS